MRFLGHTFLPHISIMYALSTIYGIGDKTAYDACLTFGISPNCRIALIPQKKWNELSERLSQTNVFIEGELRKKIKLCLSKYKELNNYKAMQFRNGYPVHGQRTHTNAKTAKRNPDTQFLRRHK